MTNRSSYSPFAPNLFPSFNKPCCDPHPPQCGNTCELACARRITPCCPPPICQCGRCDACRRRSCGSNLCQLKGIELSVVDVDPCGNLILCVRRPNECWCNGEMRPCRSW